MLFIYIRSCIILLPVLYLCIPWKVKLQQWMIGRVFHYQQKHFDNRVKQNLYCFWILQTKCISSHDYSICIDTKFHKL